MTPPPRLQRLTDSSVGQRLTQEWQGSGGHRELDTLAPERTNKDTLIELHGFQKRERGYISYISFPFSVSFPLALIGGFGPVFEKVLLRYRYIEETF